MKKSAITNMKTIIYFIIIHNFIIIDDASSVVQNE